MVKLDPKNNAPGVLVTFEGGDGSGKSTHIRFLADLLESLGIEVVCVREPGGTNVGEQLRSIVLDPQNSELSDRTELLIYEAARAQLVDEVIAPALSRGAFVLCDRFTDSTVVYQGEGRGLDKRFIEKANEFATMGITPDITIVLSCPDREEKKNRVDSRGDLDRLEGAGDDFHTRVIEGFNKLAESGDARIAHVETRGLHSDTAKAIMVAIEDVAPFLVDGSIDLEDVLREYDLAHKRSRKLLESIEQ